METESIIQGDMEGGNVFDSLASQIDPEERKALFDKLRSSESLNTKPLYELNEGAENKDINVLFQHKGFWENLVCLVMGMFTKRKPIDVFAERLIKNLRIRFEAMHPELVNFKRSVLRARFQDELLALKAAARFFYSALEASIDRDKGAFFAYLGSIEMEDIHAQLMGDCDVYKIGETNPFWDDQMILRHCLSAMDGLCSSINEDDRRRMYTSIRSLFYLRKLSAFPFDRFLMLFKSKADGSSECSITSVSELLSDLADILFSFYEPPPLALFETVFLFPHKEGGAANPETLEKEVRDSIAKAEAALQAIRKFMKAVPLAELIKAALADYRYHPKQLTGGEDWYPIYKGFWKNRIETAYSSFLRERKRMHLLKDISDFLGKIPLTKLEHVSAMGKDGGIAVRHELLLCFVVSAFDSLFIDEINRPLKILLLDGLFYRNDNRIEFTDAYSIFVKISDTVKAYDRRLAPDGDIGILHAEAVREFSSVGVKQHKVLAAQQFAVYEADKIIQDLVYALRTCINVLIGVLHPQQGSKYDSIQNFSLIEARSNAAYIQTLERAKNKLESISSLINMIAEADFIKITPSA